jgi:hypothetical protein
VNNRWYRYQNNQWVYFNKNGGGGNGNGRFDKNQWGSRKGWKNGDRDEERWDTESNSWYTFDGHDWQKSRGEHINWVNGNENESRRDKTDGRWYKYNNGRWVYDRTHN